MRLQQYGDEVQHHARMYYLFFVQYLKSRLIYKTDFALGVVSQTINAVVSLAFITLVFTQVDSIHGWTFPEMLFLAGFGGLIMNLHHTFFWPIADVGNNLIISGGFDRLLVRPLNPLFQVYSRSVAEDNIAKVLVNLALMGYAASQLSLTLLTPVKLVYGMFAIISGVLIFASMFMLFSTTAFWTGRSKAALWLIFHLSDFRKYPYEVYMYPVQILLITLTPIAFASFFPATFFLEKGQWGTMQLAALAAGPVAYYLVYQFWKHGLENYSSTGS